ncbi:MAG TPA: tetratricopeptide repeat protein [Candidatus Polarisedimenticolaceae bacterium]|nr:tetratricopeptide repeat protein [Candidatus Polarisedimenticolaceae bacterium]
MRGTWLSILPATLLLAARALAATPAGPAQEVEALLKDGKVDDAVAKGRAAVTQHPDDVDLRLATARALGGKARKLTHLVNVSVSQADIDKGQIALPAGKLDETPVQVTYDSALLEEAIVDLDEGIKRAPKREDIRFFKCFLLTDASRLDRAKTAIEDTLAALPHTPELAKTLTTFAAERTKRKDPEGGVTLLNPVIKAYPNAAAVLLDYGNMLTRIGRKKEADSAFDRAAALNPQDVRFQRTRATAAMLFRDYKRAQTAFDAVFRVSKDTQDQFASSVAAYGIDPKASASLMRDLALPSASGDSAVEDLAHSFDVVSTAGPASPAAMSLAHRLVDQKQLVLVIPVLDRAIKANPKLTEAQTMLAKVFSDLGCPKLAPGAAAAH